MAQPAGAAGQLAGELGALGQLPGAVHLLLLPEGIVGAGVLPGVVDVVGTVDAFFLGVALDAHGGAGVVLHIPEGVHAGMGADGHGGGRGATLSAFAAELALHTAALGLAVLQLGHFLGQGVTAVGSSGGLAVLIHADVFLALLIIPQGGFPGGKLGLGRIQGRAAFLAMGQGGTVPLAALWTLHRVLLIA